MSRNLNAFLDVLSHSEGTYGKGDNGYNVLVGGGLFKGYDDHPRQRIYIPNLKIYSTAAGRYQLLERYFDAYCKSLNLDDFSPSSQDAIATQQIKESKALKDIEDGYFENAAGKCAHIWASLPGAGYGQHENKMAVLKGDFVAMGGQLA